MKQPTTIELPERVAARIKLTGLVQGIGMRPAVARFARALSLAGYVENTDEGVVVHVEGPAVDVRRFERSLTQDLPAAAMVASFSTMPAQPIWTEEFIVRTAGESVGREMEKDCRNANPLATQVPPDVVACSDCIAEVAKPIDRRWGYPFTNCTNCGPRYSIIGRMPYERSQTSMAAFELCDACRREYESASDRRFHAQTNACRRCGPKVWLSDGDDGVVARGETALSTAAAAIREGRIVALRGLGGYQLVADAASQSAVERLRRRKRRLGKPLAVMASSLTEALALAHLDEAERRALAGPAGPIVVARLRSQANLAATVTSGLATVGIMLPTTPLHKLLLEAVNGLVVCTSGNLEGEPQAFEASDAVQLRGVADLWLEHDRPIHRPIDDSVVRVIAGRQVTIRLARGFAPLPLNLGVHRPLIALGGHQKTSIALTNGAQAALGPHIGDLDTVASRERYVDQLDKLRSLYGIDEFSLACDRHPDYFTTCWAEDQRLNVVRVQHHHAHVAAGMLEHGWLDRRVLGVSFDGTGYGTDGTIWGGEFLLATATGFERVAHLRPFLLPGGERAVREPWRVATALVREAAGETAAAALRFCRGDAGSLLPVLRLHRFSPTTTSAGRLFDGVAALALGVEQCLFEGHAAMLLEDACDQSEHGIYRFSITGGCPRELDWRPLVRQLLRDRASGVSAGAMAMRFHRGLAQAICDVARSYPELPVVLGGGVFQNRVLVELIADQLRETNQPLGLPGVIPPNDGGLAAGQLAVAVALQQGAG